MEHFGDFSFSFLATVALPCFRFLCNKTDGGCFRFLYKTGGGSNGPILVPISPQSLVMISCPCRKPREPRCLPDTFAMPLARLPRKEGPRRSVRSPTGHPYGVQPGLKSLGPNPKPVYFLFWIVFVETREAELTGGRPDRPKIQA